MTEETKARGLTPELRKMAEDSGFWISDGGNVEAREEAIEAFARLVAEDCAKICQEKCWGDSYEASEYAEPEHPTSGAAAIRSKYAP